MVLELRRNIADIGTIYDLCLGTSQACSGLCFLFSLTIIMKKVGESTRGSMLALNATVGSISIMFLQLYGGYLFDKVSKEGPYIITAGVFCAAAILGLTLNAFGKLNDH